MAAQRNILRQVIKPGLVTLLLGTGLGSASAEESGLLETLLDQSPRDSSIELRSVDERLWSPVITESSDSAERSLILQSSSPLFLELNTSYFANQNDQFGMGVNSSLGINAGDGLSFELNSQQSVIDSRVGFHALGDIQCENGILEPGAYSATNCQFIGDQAAPSSLTNSLLSVGPRVAIGDSGSVGISYFQSRTQASPSRSASELNNAALRMPWEEPLSPLATSPFSPVAGFYPNGVNSQTEGVNLDLQLGFATYGDGSLKLGVQLARIHEVSTSGFGLDNSGLPYVWAPKDPFNSAKLDIDWSYGPFSAGIQSFYRDPIELLNQQTLNGQTTFDIRFTWRTPWNANLSIGAANALDGSRDEESDDGSEAFDDPFEMIYGRVPYVRYEQDL